MYICMLHALSACHVLRIYNVCFILTALRSVSMYEIGEFVYLFFLEEALETTENVSYIQSKDM